MRNIILSLSIAISTMYASVAAAQVCTKDTYVAASTSCNQSSSNSADFTVGCKFTPAHVQTDVIPCPSISYNFSAARQFVTKADFSVSIDGSFTDTYGSPSLVPVIQNVTGAPVVTISPPLPAGLSINSANGTISGTATAAVADKTYTVSMIVGTGTYTDTFRLETIQRPTVAYPDVVAFVGDPENVSPTISNKPTGSVISVSPALPSGLTLNSATGVISGTPSAPSATKTYTATLAYGGLSVTDTFTLEVKPRPVIAYASYEQVYVKWPETLRPTSLSNIPAGASFSLSYTSPPRTPDYGFSINPVTGDIPINVSYNGNPQTYYYYMTVSVTSHGHTFSSNTIELRLTCGSRNCDRSGSS